MRAAHHACSMPCAAASRLSSGTLTTPPPLPAGWNSGSCRPSLSGSQVTVTAMPLRTSSGGQPTTLVIMRTPSSSSTSATQYGCAARRRPRRPPRAGARRRPRTPWPARWRVRHSRATGARAQCGQNDTRVEDALVARRAPLDEEPALARVASQKGAALRADGRLEAPGRSVPPWLPAVLTAWPPCRAPPWT